MSKEPDCDNCYYNQGGCRSEELTAGSCCYSPLTKKDRQERAEEALKHFKATIKHIEDVINDPAFIKAYKRYATNANQQSRSKPE